MDQVNQSPPLIIDRGIDLEIVALIDRAGAVDQERLEQRRAGSQLPFLEKLLHQGQQAAHRRGRSAGAARELVMGCQSLVELVQLFVVFGLARFDGDDIPDIVRHGNLGRIADAEMQQSGLQDQGRVGLGS